MTKPAESSAGTRGPPKSSSLPLPKPTSTGGGWSAQPSRLDGDFGARRPVVATAGDTGRGDLVQGGQAGGVDSAENRVGGRQLRIAVNHEELAAVGVRSGIGHRQRASGIQHRPLERRIAGRVLIGRILVGELIARTAGAVTVGIAALQYRQSGRGGQSVALGVVEEL